MRRLARADIAEIPELRRRGEAFVLDLCGGSADDDLEAITKECAISTELVGEAGRYGQHPRLERFEDHTLLVLFGAREDKDGQPQPEEVHLLLAADHAIVLHQAPIPELERIRIPTDPGLAISPVIAALIDSLLTGVEAIDDEIDSLEDEIIERLDETQMKRLTDLRRSLVGIRHIGTPQRDLFLRHGEELGRLPGMSPAAAREASTRMVTLRDVVDSARELASGALDLYLSTASNRLNLFAERLTIVTIVVLPLVVVTGFFGQNFAWLTTRIDSLDAFLIFGLLLPAALAIGLLRLLRRLGYV